MKTINRYLFLLALSAFFGTAAYAGDVVKDTLGTTSSSVQTVEALLQGQVAGVRVWSQDGSPLSATGVTIRGVNSLRGGQQPLYIVDGTMINESNAKNIDPLWQLTDTAYASPLSPLSFLAPNDIESIEVLKNASATALYGSKGANGVVIIKTRRINDDRSRVIWDSNVSLATPQVGDYTRMGVSHNHKVTVGSTKNMTGYTLSAYFRDDNYIIPGTGSILGGLRAAFDTKANSVVWFGLNSTVTVGKNENLASTAWYGKESLTTAIRNKDAKAEGWISDYDDDALTFRAVNSMWLKLNLFKGFSFNFDLGTDFMSSTRNFWWGNDTPTGAEMNGMAAILKTSSFAYNADASFDYICNIADDHQITASLGAQGFGSMEMLNTMNGNDFFDHVLRTKGMNIAASNVVLNKHNINDFTLGLTGKIGYSWRGILGIDAAYRNDFSPESGKWTSYPSVSAFCDIRKAAFEDSYALSTLKVEGGYGESGKAEWMPYQFFGNYTSGAYETVEKTAEAFYDGRYQIHAREWNISLAMGFVEDRIALEAGFYGRKTSDVLSLYCNGEIFSQDGVSFWKYADRKEISAQESIIENNGVEFSLTGVPVKTQDWNWSINVNGAYNTNQLAEVAIEDAAGKPVGGGLKTTANVVGRPVSSIVDQTGTVYGNPIPKYYGGLSTALRWKDLTLDVLADGAAGFNILNMNAMALDGATKVQPKYIEKGDFFRLARVSLSYGIPMQKVKWIESFKVFASACNLAVATDYSGWNPDVNSFAASTYRLGMDYGSCPAARSFVLGLSIKF